MDRLPSTQKAITPYSAYHGDLTSFNYWLFDAIAPYLQGRVLEMGSDLTTISSVFAQHGNKIHLSTPNKLVQDQLREKYKGVDTVRMIHSIDPRHPNFEQFYNHNFRVFDTILVLNAMEDGFFDDNVILNSINLLTVRGRLILLAPAYTAVYNDILEDLKCLKKYNRQKIRNMISNKMEMLKTYYFNLSSTFASKPYCHAGLSVIAIAQKTE
jgi:hypothetical protein